MEFTSDVKVIELSFKLDSFVFRSNPMRGSVVKTLTGSFRQENNQQMEGLKEEQVTETKELIRTQIARLRLQLSTEIVEQLRGELEAHWERRFGEAYARRIYIPQLNVDRPKEDNRFMRYSTCSTSDFFIPDFSKSAGCSAIPPYFIAKCGIGYMSLRN